MKKFGVYAWPAFSTKKGNPYNYLIYDELVKLGYPVYEFEPGIKSILKSGYSSKYQLFHIHWPSNILTAGSYSQAQRRLYTFFFFIKTLKVLNKKVVWTVHNLESHEGEFPDLEKKLNDFLYKHVDGFISLNKSGLELIKKKASNTKKQFFKYIPHPHYVGYYPNSLSKEEARTKLEIPADKFVFLFLGQIRAYKNVIGLVRAYNLLDAENKYLIVAGNVHHDVKEELMPLLTGAKDILLKNGFVEDDDLQLYLNAADLVVTPYTQIFNSGSVFLNLSFNVPTLAPEVWAIADLKDEVGGRWIKTYNGQISHEALLQGMKEIMSAKDINPLEMPNLDHLHPKEVANSTMQFFQEITGLG